MLRQLFWCLPLEQLCHLSVDFSEVILGVLFVSLFGQQHFEGSLEHLCQASISAGQVLMMSLLQLEVLLHPRLVRSSDGICLQLVIFLLDFIISSQTQELGFLDPFLKVTATNCMPHRHIICFRSSNQSTT